MDNPQFIAFVNGEVKQGLDVNHTDLMLYPNAPAGEAVQLDLYAYSGRGQEDAPVTVELAVLQERVQRLYYHIQVPLEVVELLDEEDMRRVQILNYLNEAVNLLDMRRTDIPQFYESVERALAYLDSEFYGAYCGGKSDATEICVGHTHIDVAWLWTLAQTREKAVHSFATVLALMERYPDYIFMSSQPQLYQFVKEDQPELYERIKRMVKEGRWEADGAMWLEADCNLTSGESLVRQILFGTRFFRSEFGVENKILWLPDVFGYSAALPQILKKSGIDYFMTTKISWNEFNKLPYDTFLWEGIDGTEILTHFITTRDYSQGEIPTGTTYVGMTNVTQTMGCWQRYQQKEINDTVLNCFGYGDGGGGPTSWMLEYVERTSKGIPGAPRVRMGTAREFFAGLEQKVSGNRRLPKWVGELYLEFHRGTYTSMARNKKWNRQAEFWNMDAEWSSVMARELLDLPYPQQQINDCWRTTLLNQFHDIIPGSSIHEVYEDSKKQYDELLKCNRAIARNAMSSIARNVRTEETSVLVFNQLGFARNDLVSTELPQGWKAARVFDGSRELATQLTGNGELLFFAEDVQAKGYKTFCLRKAETCGGAAGMTVRGDFMENDFFRIQLDDQGCITSLFDKRNCREVLQKGARGNVLEAFEDKPSVHDAWNLDIYYQEKMWEINDVESIRVVEDGSVRCALEISRRFLQSTIRQTIYLYHQIPRVDFGTWIDWKEHQVFLKAAFPVDVHASSATYEIQFGNVERPTHWNTSWDWARFEVCAQKWADLSEGGYGVSLLNDCKYGHDIKDSVMRLSLLKSGIDPNQVADQEVHEFTYSLYPHADGWKEADTALQAYTLNCPLYALVEPAHEGTLPGEFSLVSIDCGNVQLETVKKAEDGEEIVLRCYEYHNRRTKVVCTACKELERVMECDMMEQNGNEVAVSGNQFTFEIAPYEIKTFRIALKK